MKTIIYTIALFLSGNLIAQGNIRIDNELFMKLLKKEFAKIYTPETKNGVGNYASYDVVDSKVDFTGNIILKKDIKFFRDTLSTSGNILSIKASGGVSDGVVGLFSNNKWNNNVGLDVQYNFIRLTGKNGKNYIDIDADQLAEYQRKKEFGSCSERNLNPQNALSDHSLQLQLAESELIIAKAKVISGSSNIQKCKTALDRFNKAGNKDSIAYYSLKLAEHNITFWQDSMKLEKSNCIRDSIFNMTPNQILNAVLIKRNRRNKALKDDLVVNGFRINWFSFGYGVSNNSFRLFDPVQSFGTQFSASSFLTQELRLQYNIYKKEKNGNSYFLSFWLKGSIADNFEALTKNDFEEITTDTLSTTERNNIKKFSAYSGDYKKNLQRLTFGMDWYYFLTGNTMAIHLFPKYTIIQNLQPETSFGVGFLMPFKNKDEKKDIVNAEIYMNTPNLFRTNGITETNFFKRSEYGIRFSVPIMFNN
ncbi:MAG: hypothetical protein A3D31_14965 [Candidatus Fluviicola riflensis]|nr:MAG: hypothetical protein CHH17_19400 [Candidatus Fluviicola riflensis]OGS78265.1 MAG: hypothetical protein A3D31_14965 [Candidatus Fluviicola riflensis]OGS85331.1 MAG: hypothetical protein A2724_11900 [Fluviicola sp. RIFCSPHIGHO2_01_FULL_43_53]OGS87373.1 MAG: hypothetical protein A3E30_08320 [Fluviicola sp. RIFCSPHIGHO2_12_FULL_43_24]